MSSSEQPAAALRSAVLPATATTSLGAAAAAELARTRSAVADCLRQSGAIVQENLPLAPFTHLRIGGPADWFVEPRTEAEAAQVLRSCRDLGLPVYLLGGGSNVLVADAGLRGVVLHLGQLNRLVRDGSLVTAGAGVSLNRLLRETREAGLAGLERLTGIPAMVGGAVAMNAGTRDGETFDLLASLTVALPDGRIEVWGPERCRPRYRDGGLGGALVLQASFALQPDDPQAIFARFSASLQQRNHSQPVAQRSVGCVFRNPPGEAAGRLIERAGLKNRRQGAIEVSARHANYFVNDGNGTAADFLALLQQVQHAVQQHSGIELLPEVKFWGF